MTNYRLQSLYIYPCCLYPCIKPNHLNADSWICKIVSIQSALGPWRPSLFCHLSSISKHNLSRHFSPESAVCARCRKHFMVNWIRQLSREMEEIFNVKTYIYRYWKIWKEMMGERDFCRNTRNYYSSSCFVHSLTCEIY